MARWSLPTNSGGKLGLDNEFGLESELEQLLLLIRSRGRGELRINLEGGVDGGGGRGIVLNVKWVAGEVKVVTIMEGGIDESE